MADNEQAKPTYFISKAKILKKGVQIDYVKHEANKQSSGSEESPNEAHKDFVKAMQKLRAHFALKCFFIDPATITKLNKIPAKDLDIFNVTGFTINGGEKMNSFIISGSKTLPDGSVLNLNTPQIRNTDEPDGVYLWLDDLITSIGACQTEAQEYLLGKIAPNPQGDLFKKEEDEEQGA